MTRTLRTIRLQEPATKVGVMVTNESVKVELLSECSYVSSSGIRWCISLHSDIQTDHYK